MIVQGVNTYRSYFNQWALHHSIHDSNEVWIRKLVQALNEPPADDDMIYLVPSSSWNLRNQWHYSLRYLYTGEASLRLIDVSSSDLAEAVNRESSSKKDLSSVKVVEWKTANRWKRDDFKLLTFLLNKYGHYKGSDEYADFRTHNYEDFSLEHSWEFYERMEPLTVLYDGGIALLGLALGQGESQPSKQSLIDLGPNRSLWGVLKWQIDSDLDFDYATSLRLYSTAGEMFYQNDDVLWNPTNHLPTSQWLAGEEVESLFYLEFPADLPPGEYELRMVVYDFETLVPTVEIGVWKPEVTLTRLQITDAE